MSTQNTPGRTNNELLQALRAPFARFYPYDLHTHSLGSHDVCYGIHFDSLPVTLRAALQPQDRHIIRDADARLTHSPDVAISLPLRTPPADRHKHDRDVSHTTYLQAYYDCLRQRRNTVTTEHNLESHEQWCVVGVTDHDTAEFSTALAALAWSRKRDDHLIVLPGMELEVQVFVTEATSQCSLHILCLFAPCTTSSDIRLAINAALPAGQPAWDFGRPLPIDALPPFIHQLRAHQQYPAACVAAHVWSTKGIQKEPTKLLFKSLDAAITRLQGELDRATAEQDRSAVGAITESLQHLAEKKADPEGIHDSVLKMIGQCGFDGLQVRDRSHETHYRRLHRFRDRHGRAIPIVCSDAHTPTGIFRAGENTPFIKLDANVLRTGTPNDVLDEVRNRALRFGETRTTYSSPGSVSYWIEGIEITPDAGSARQFWEPPESKDDTNPHNASFTLALSRNLNCFIGGRGSGKSALIEAIAFLTDSSRFKDEGSKKNETQRAEWYRRAEATLRGCKLRLVWKSTASDGTGALPRRALFATRYFDAEGRHDEPELRDAKGEAIVDAAIALPRVQLLRAHEIEQTAQTDNLRSLLDNLCDGRISTLTSRIETLRDELSTQRESIVTLCTTLVALTREFSPLRQYGIRKRQFDAVDKPELRERFEQVDEAEAVSRAARRANEAWGETGATKTIAILEATLNAFFTRTAESATDDTGCIRPGHDLLHAEVASSSPKADSIRAKIMPAIRTAAVAIANGGELLNDINATATVELTKRMDDLAKDGLPTGSSERDAKKKAFDEAKGDYEKYRTLVKLIDDLLDERKRIFERLVDACRERTTVRVAHARELTRQLRRDLDGDVLRIEVCTKPLAETREFSAWLRGRLLDKGFLKFRAQREAAILESGLQPQSLRQILLNHGNPDMSELTNDRTKAEDGRITQEDCKVLLNSCRARIRALLDDADQFSDEFAASLPTDLRDGVLLYQSDDETLTIDYVLRLDEVVLDDAAEVLLNDRPLDPGSTFRPLQELSPGQRCSAILPLLLLSGHHPLVIDQPEENLDNRLIRQVIVNILASMKLKRQVIVATHNPNLPVLGDAEQCVILQASGRDLSRVVAVGNLDAPDVARYITEIMEGGREAFQYRQSIYQRHWDGVVDSE